MTNTIALCGGGTCGHIMPNIALLPELKQHFESVVYLGEAHSQEEKMAEKYSLTFYATQAIKLERKKVWKNLTIPTTLHRGVKQAVEILSLLQPSVVFSKGGYASLPTCLACKKLNIPVVIHESDTTIGVANKLVSRFANHIITSSKDTPLLDNRYIHIGNPIRSELLNGNKTTLVKALKLRPNYPNILVFGGSLGAKAINELISTSLYQLLKQYNILHIVGNNTNIENIKIKGYYPLRFASNIGDYYATSDLIISRAGASAISEIRALGKRAIFIPLPKGTSRGDQVTNAEKVTSNGVYVLAQERATTESLLAMIEQAFDAPPPPSDYDPTIPKRIIDVILSSVKR